MRRHWPQPLACLVVAAIAWAWGCTRITCEEKATCPDPPDASLPSAGSGSGSGSGSGGGSGSGSGSGSDSGSSGGCQPSEDCTNGVDDNCNGLIDCADPACGAGVPDAAEPDPDDEAVLLMTSGTTAAPKSAVLRHRHLVSYILGSVDFGAAGREEAVIVSVPPYHIAAVANLLSNLYSGRRIVYLNRFTARSWLEVTSAERITHAMVVPTMLARITAELESGTAPLPRHLRSLSYGGAPLSPKILARALALLPDVGFVNAYGLTETSSSIAVLGPEDHRAAVASDDPAVRARLGSVGLPLPEVEVEVRSADGGRCAPGETGLIYVRGPQVAGEYRETGEITDSGGWFSTRDEGYLDEAGYLFVRGRADDTIIRGGENIAPAEIEAVLEQMPGVAEVAVVGLPSEEWGQQIGAFVVPKQGTELSAEDVREFARAKLRSSKTPDTVIFVAELPHTPTGKLLRRQLATLAGKEASPAGPAEQR